MIAASHVVTEAHRRLVADEDGSGAGEVGSSLFGIHEVQFEVLRRIGVAERRGHGPVVDEDDGGLRPRQRGGDAFAVPGDRGDPLHLDGDLFCELGRVGDKHGGRLLIVLGLAHEVGGDETRIRVCIGDHEDLRRPSFESVPTTPATARLADAT